MDAVVRTGLGKAELVVGKRSMTLLAIRNNCLSTAKQTLSYADYYARYGTTEPQDGWHMENPTGQKVIYVKN